MQVSTNGVISFGLPFSDYRAILFHMNMQHHVVAPYWIDNDASLNGIVSWQIHNSGDSILSDDIIYRVSNFIRMNTNSTNFNGKYVFIGNWSEMNKYPAASNLNRVSSASFMCNYTNSFLQNNSYQAVLITDGQEKSFAVFTFKCGTLNWSGRATTGFNAGGNYYANHPLSKQWFSSAISCLNNHSVWNNVVYDLTSSTQYTIGQQPESCKLENIDKNRA